MRGQTRYLLHCVKRITLASAGKENSTELMFAPHPSPLPTGEGKKQSAFCFTGRAEHRASDSLSTWDREKNRAHFVLRKEQNTAQAIPSARGRGRKAERFLFYGKSRTPHERFPLSSGEGEKQSAFCFTGGAEHRTNDSLSRERGLG